MRGMAPPRGTGSRLIDLSWLKRERIVMRGFPSRILIAPKVASATDHQAGSNPGDGIGKEVVP